MQDVIQSIASINGYPDADHFAVVRAPINNYLIYTPSASGNLSCMVAKFIILKLQHVLAHTQERDNFLFVLKIKMHKCNETTCCRRVILDLKLILN